MNPVDVCLEELNSAVLNRSEYQHYQKIREDQRELMAQVEFDVGFWDQ